MIPEITLEKLDMVQAAYDDYETPDEDRTAIFRDIYGVDVLIDLQYYNEEHIQ